MHFFDDHDKLWNDFDRGCYDLGESKCALWEPTAEGIKKRRLAILESLRTKPVVIPARAAENGPKLPTLFTYSKAKMTMVSVSYSPFGVARKIAEALAALETGDAVPIYKLSGATSLTEGAGDLCLIADTPAALPMEGTLQEAQTAVVVASDNGNSLQSSEELEEYIERASKVSSEIGRDAAFLRAGGAARSVAPKWRFSHSKFIWITKYTI